MSRLGGASQFHGQNSSFFLTPPGEETVTEDSRAVIQFLDAQKWGYRPNFSSLHWSKTLSAMARMEENRSFSEAERIARWIRNFPFSTTLIDCAPEGGTSLQSE